MAKRKRTWKLIDIDTSKVMCRGYSPHDLLQWYHLNHFDSWYLNGRRKYNMVCTGKSKKYFL